MAQKFHFVKPTCFIQYRINQAKLNCCLYSTMDTELQAQSKSLSGWPLYVDHFSQADMTYVAKVLQKMI